MLQRLRTALHNRTFGNTTKIGGPDNEVEVDETFVGGLTKNMHKGRKIRMVQQGGIHGGKTIVQGLLDRNLRQVRATVVPDVKRETLQNEILKNVQYGTRSIRMRRPLMTMGCNGACLLYTSRCV